MTAILLLANAEDEGEEQTTLLVVHLALKAKQDAHGSKKLADIIRRCIPRLCYRSLWGRRHSKGGIPGFGQPFTVVQKIKRIPHSGIRTWRRGMRNETKVGQECAACRFTVLPRFVAEQLPLPGLYVVRRKEERRDHSSCVPEQRDGGRLARPIRKLSGC